MSQCPFKSCHDHRNAVEFSDFKLLMTHLRRKHPVDDSTFGIFDGPGTLEFYDGVRVLSLAEMLCRVEAEVLSRRYEHPGERW